MGTGLAVIGSWTVAAQLQGQHHMLSPNTFCLDHRGVKQVVSKAILYLQHT